MHLHEEAREAGWSDEQLLEAIAYVALESFTAMVNVAGDVPVDGSSRRRAPRCRRGVGRAHASTASHERAAARTTTRPSSSSASAGPARSSRCSWKAARLRFSEIARGRARSSRDRLLSERMKELEARGLVERRVVAGPPARRLRADATWASELRAGRRRAAGVGAPLVRSGAPVSLPRACTDHGRPARPPTTSRRIVEERNIRFIRLWFTDILGQLKSFSINRAELEDAFEGGMGFDGSSITGFNAIEESDMIAMPDPRPSRCCPGGPRSRASARMFCDVLTPERDALRGRPAPRAAPRAGARAARWASTRFNVGPELEYFLFRTTRAPRSSTRAATSTSRRSTPAPTCAARPSSRSSSSASTSSTPTTRSARPSTRSTCATPTR